MREVDPKTPKILIVYASAGAGHKKAAEAIYGLLPPDARAESLDLIDYLPQPARYLYTKGYLALITHFGWLWGILYFLSDTRWLSLINVHLRRFVNRVTSRNFISELLKKSPDIVISTHFGTSEIVSYAKAKYGLKTRLINVITDFGVHNFWLSEGVDIYCCASESTEAILIRKGVPREKIKITGIPIDKKFIAPLPYDEIRLKFNLKKDIPAVLIVTGGIGAGPIEEIVESLKDEAQCLVVCGNNKNLYHRLSQKQYVNVRLFGFVDFMHLLMGVSHVIVTKAGGLTTAESLAMGLPMIFFFLIPGQETINAVTIQSLGAGRVARTPLEIRNAVLGIFGDPKTFDAYRKRSLSLGRPQASAEILKFLQF